jgi:hypothetical protein
MNNGVMSFMDTDFSLRSRGELDPSVFNYQFITQTDTYKHTHSTIEDIINSTAICMDVLSYRIRFFRMAFIVRTTGQRQHLIVTFQHQRIPRQAQS